MAIKIEPYTYENKLLADGMNITYWAVYLDDDQISVTSTREKAEETKQWMEQWLSRKN